MTERLTAPQGEAVLDVLEQCRVVTAAFHQQAAFQSSGGASIEKDRRKTVETSVTDSYKVAIGYLTDLYVRASEELEVHDDVLCQVLAANLPSDLDLTIGVPT